MWTISRVVTSDSENSVHALEHYEIIHQGQSTFYSFNSVQNEIYPGNKYQNTNNLDLLSCSRELSMKTFYDSGSGHYHWTS